MGVARGTLKDHGLISSLQYLLHSLRSVFGQVQPSVMYGVCQTISQPPIHPPYIIPCTHNPSILQRRHPNLLHALAIQNQLLVLPHTRRRFCLLADRYPCRTIIIGRGFRYLFDLALLDLWWSSFGEHKLSRFCGRCLFLNRRTVYPSCC